MWLFIMLAMFLATVLAVIYLVTRFYKFTVMRWLAKERKPVQIILSFFSVLLILGLSWLLLGMMNAMIILIHLMVIWFFCDLCNMFIRKKRGVETKRYYAGAIALFVTIIYMGTGWYLAHNVWCTAYTVDTDKMSGNLRIVQIADSHVGTTFDGEGFAGHIKKIQEEKPDVVVVTGDYVDDDTSREDMVAACKALGSLQTTYGTYYVFGNHDKGYYGSEYRGYSGDDLVAELKKNGVSVLQDESVLLDNRFYIIGRQDRSEGANRMEMNDLVKNLDKSKYMIVLDHQPHDYDAQKESGVDLVLSGHTHGGQLFPINYVGEWTKENEKTYGLMKRENTNFIVTSGISDWAIRFKTGCKSEYVLVDVKGNK